MTISRTCALMSALAFVDRLPAWNALRRMVRSGEDELVQSKLYSLPGVAKNKALVQDALSLALTPEPSATTSATIASEAAENYPDQVVDSALAHIEQMDALVDTSSRSSNAAKARNLCKEPINPGIVQTDRRRNNCNPDTHKRPIQNQNRNYQVVRNRLTMTASLCG